MDEPTNIVYNTSVPYAVSLFSEKKEMIAKLEYECRLLIDKYHEEMRRAAIPFVFRDEHLNKMYGDSSEAEDIERRMFARKLFLEKGFSKRFLDSHKIEFLPRQFEGYNRTSVIVRLRIGDWDYHIRFPQPQNVSPTDKSDLMGSMQFSVNKCPKSQENEFVKLLERVQGATYDWKECFEAIEKAVNEARQ